MTRKFPLVCLMLVLVLGASVAASTVAQPEQIDIDCQSPEFFALCFEDGPVVVPVQDSATEPVLIDVGDGPILACIEADLDSDGDGLSDACEAVLGTDPANWDTDGDGFSDKTERDLGRDPLVITNDDDSVDYGGFANATVTPPPPLGDAPAGCANPSLIVLCLEDDGPLVSDAVAPSPTPPSGEASSDCASDFVAICFEDGPVMPSDDRDGDGLANDREDWIGTDPDDPDTDGDGVDDGQEMQDGTNPSTPDAGAGATGCLPDFAILCVGENQPVPDGTPTDFNGVDDVEVACSITVSDRDGDGITDACEVEIGTDPDNADTDGDDLSDDDEINRYGTSPVNRDTDGDSLGDGNEVNRYSTDPLDGDTDEDGLDDGFDLGSGTDPLNSDHDSDGLVDGDELHVYGTFPRVADSDGDGAEDGDEVRTYATNPLDADMDQDCLSDGDEITIYRSSPKEQDSDNDGFYDGTEVYDGTDPIDASDVPGDLLWSPFNSICP